MARNSQKQDAEVAAEVAQSANNASTATEQPDPKRGPGAPRGNQHRTTHGLTRATKRNGKPRNSDKFDTAGRRWATQTADYYGLDKRDPRRRLLAFVQAGILRTRARCNVRGWSNASGELKATAQQHYALLDKLRDVLRDLEGERMPDPSGDLQFKIQFDDGAPYADPLPPSVESEAADGPSLDERRDGNAVGPPNPAPDLGDPAPPPLTDPASPEVRERIAGAEVPTLDPEAVGELPDPDTMADFTTARIQRYAREQSGQSDEARLRQRWAACRDDLDGGDDDF